MKALNQTELEQLVEIVAEKLRGAQLQEVKSYERGLALSFYLRQTFWLVLDVEKSVPFIGIFDEENPWNMKTKTKPVALFVNSHAKNLFLDFIQMEKQWGRVVSLKLINKTKACDISFHLIPQRINLIVHSENKKISWAPVLDLSLQEEKSFDEVRSIPQLHREWLQQFSSRAVVLQKSNPLAVLEKSKQKKQKALQEIEKKRQEHLEQSKIFFALGEELKGMTKEQLRHHIQSHLLDLKKGVSWNMEYCFEQAKQMQRKAAGALQRRNIVEQEISELDEKMCRKDLLEKGEPELAASSKNELKTDLKLRKLDLSSGSVAYRGKTAKDNLDLLRRSRAWDYWMHLKDEPGAHVIIRREKNQIVPESEFAQVAQWLVEETILKKNRPQSSRINVVLVECRFVRPIKGDKLGRVNYHSARELIVRTKEEGRR